MNRDSNQNKPQSKSHFWTISVVILFVIACSYWALYQIMQAETSMRYTGLQQVVSAKIGKTISGMELSATNMFNEVEKNLDSPQSAMEALESESHLNPDVRGYFAAFAPYYFKEKGQWFEPYIHQNDSGEFVMSELGPTGRDYSKSTWYIQAEKTRQPFWCDPYYYYDGSSISGHYCTFVKPVLDANGQLVCVCGADITFEWINKELQRIDESCREAEHYGNHRLMRDFNFFSVILYKDGTCIAYPSEKHIGITDTTVINRLANSETGVTEILVDGVPSTLYYGPIESVDWSVAIVTPTSDLRKPFLYSALLMLLLAIIALLIAWKLCKKIPRSI